MLAVGFCAGRSIEIRYLPKPDIESVATINSIRLLLAAAQELDRARAEREQTLTLWPVDDEPPSEDGFILLGKMADLMTVAKRVAKANVTVLITGESGTGKEILARAIHTYSDRARETVRAVQLRRDSARPGREPAVRPPPRRVHRRRPRPARPHPRRPRRHDVPRRSRRARARSAAEAAPLSRIGRDRTARRDGAVQRRRPRRRRDQRQARNGRSRKGDFARTCSTD